MLYNGDPRWRAATDLRDLIGLPEVSSLWQWQPGMRYHLIDEGAFAANDLEGLDGLPALLFGLENATDRDHLLAVSDAAMAWFARHPGFQSARTVFVEFLRAAMAPLGPAALVPAELLEVRNMLATRVEEWKQQWLREGEQHGLAALLLRQLEFRFGSLPGWVQDRVLAAEGAMIEAWGLRVLDAGSLEEVFA